MKKIKHAFLLPYALVLLLLTITSSHADNGFGCMHNWAQNTKDFYTVCQADTAKYHEGMISCKIFTKIKPSDNSGYTLAGRYYDAAEGPTGPYYEMFYSVHLSSNNSSVKASYNKAIDDCGCNTAPLNPNGLAAGFVCVKA